MKEKLTKNDSMSKKDRNFDVKVASFEAFIKRENSHGEYFQDWANQQHYNDIANVFYAWREWAKDLPPQSWIIGAFVWRFTKRGYHFWALMDREWTNWCNQNLKK